VTVEAKFEYIVRIDVPAIVRPAMMMIATNEAMSPYSIAVAPSSSRTYR
jgi:hypothetical protein